LQISDPAKNGETGKSVQSEAETLAKYLLKTLHHSYGAAFFYVADNIWFVDCGGTVIPLDFH